MTAEGKKIAFFLDLLTLLILKKVEKTISLEAV